jgi:hypothetical protein
LNGVVLGVAVAVGVGVGLTLGVGVGVGVAVAVAVAVAVGVAVGVAVTLGVAVGEAVAVGVGVGVACTTTLQDENSEVLLFGSVAVAVTTCPPCTLTGRVTSIVALQLASVGISLEPMKVCPSPLPSGSHCGLSKNSTRKVELGALFKLP